MEHNDWKNFVEYPEKKDSDVSEDPVMVQKAKSVTNGDIIAEAIRNKDRGIQILMDDKFKEWCEQTKESPYSNGAKRFWKSLPYGE